MIAMWILGIFQFLRNLGRVNAIIGCIRGVNSGEMGGNYVLVSRFLLAANAVFRNLLQFSQEKPAFCQSLVEFFKKFGIMTGK